MTGTQPLDAETVLSDAYDISDHDHEQKVWLVNKLVAERNERIKAEKALIVKINEHADTLADLRKKYAR